MNRNPNLATKVLSRLFGKVRTSDDRGWEVVTGGASNLGRLSVHEELKQYKGWIYSTGQAIAAEAAMIQFVLKQRRGDDSVVIMRHPLLDLLQKPNPYWNRDEVFQLLALHIFLTGKAYWYVNKPGRLPREVEPLYVDRVSIKRDKRSFVESYDYYTNSGATSFKIDEVIPFRNIDPLDFFNGVGVVSALSSVLKTDDQAMLSMLSSFKNMAFPGGALTTDKRMSKEAIKTLARLWRETHQGTENTNKVAVLDSGMKFQPIGQSSSDVQLLEGRKYSEHTIRGTARVPGAALGIEATSNRSTAEANDYTFAKRVIKPMFRTITSALNHWLAPMYGDDLYIDFVDPIPPDKEYNLRRQTESVKVGWKKPNEARAEAGLPPTEGGDELLIPNNFRPINQEPQTPNAPVAPQPEPEDDGEDED